MKTMLLILFCAFLWHNGSSQDATRPAYSGTIDYTMGNFGTYDYPDKGDSVHVFLKGDKLTFVLFSTGKGSHAKTVSHEFDGLALVSKKEYESIETPTKTVKTGKFDMKFSGKGKASGDACSMYLGHYSDGSSATLTLMVENGLRLYDLCIINLKRAD